MYPCCMCVVCTPWRPPVRPFVVLDHVGPMDDDGEREREREIEREEWSDLVLVSILAPSFVVGSCLDRLSLFCSSAEVISFPSRGGRFPI